MLTPSRSKRDAGFTLVELVVSMALLGVVMAAICGAMVTSLRTTAESEDRLGDSGDVQFASTWFGDDVAGANDVIAGGTARCGSDSAVVVQFLNRDQAAPTARPTVAPSPAATPTPAPVALQITYALRPITTPDGTFRELHRLACTATGTLRTDDVIARRLSAAVPTPTVSARAVSLRLTPAAADAAPFTLHGTRRSS
ncbi:MAG: PulJ/GspJ family protein [Sporichthyaceae bacterium]